MQRRRCAPAASPLAMSAAAAVGVVQAAGDVTVAFPSKRVACTALCHSLVVACSRSRHITSARNFAGSSIRYVGVTTAFGPAHHDVLSSELVHLIRAFFVVVLCDAWGGQ